jgi:predicted ATPase/transcriptional regulator with XRE-family HTH domain
LAAGLTQEELAERARLSPRAISDLERGARRRPWRETIQLLADALHLDGAARDKLEAAARPGRLQDRVAFRSDASPPRSTVPVQITSFVGREAALDACKHLLANNRLLTLTGVGGCGKTRLAYELVETVMGDFSDGIAVVELASLTDPALVAQMVATSLGVRSRPDQPILAALVSHLEPRQCLVVLDNCEHLLDPCASLATVLLQACPGVTLLTTSRERLRVGGEVCWPVPALATPNPVGLSAEGGDVIALADQYAAIRLFADRARSVNPSFTLTGQNVATVAQVCWQLDGMPLAIELAAGQIRALPLEVLASRLNDRLRLLVRGSRTSHPRQQTLRAAIDWSYMLLNRSEQLLFRRLAIFAGGFTVEAGEAVCAGDGIAVGEILPLLTALVDKSLVDPPLSAGPARYRLLETIRQYAGEQLESSGERDASRWQHASYFGDLAERDELRLRGPEQREATAELEDERANLRAAVTWLRASGRAELACRLAGALGTFWLRRGPIEEARATLEAVLAMPVGPEPTWWRAKALNRLGGVAQSQHDFPTARTALTESLAIYRDLGDRRRTANLVGDLGYLEFLQGHLDAALPQVEEAVSILRELGDNWNLSYRVETLGQIAFHGGDYQQAQVYLKEALEAATALGELARSVSVRSVLGRLAVARGDWDEAQTQFRAVLAVSTDFDLGDLLAFVLDGQVDLAVAQKRDAAAVRWAGVAAQLRVSINRPQAAVWRMWDERVLQVARGRLTSEQFARAWAEGQAMTLEQAIALALGDERPER